MKSIAIITRTKNRPIMLKRALYSSILKQTYTNFQWIIVNDGGEKKPIDNIIKEAKQMKIDVKVINNSQSLGMEAASNVGVKNSKSKYILIHDDDDTLEPDFVGKTIDFLENNSQYHGVVTHTTQVKEKIKKEKIKFISKKSYNYHLSGIYLIDVLAYNPFVPISFVFKRNVFKKIGYFNETLPVIGDWDFHIRFLKEYDIGIITEPLANYHLRDTIKNKKNIYGNTIISSNDLHAKYDTLLRNKYIREDLKKGELGIGILMNLVYRLENIRTVYSKMNKIISLLDIIYSPIKKLIGK